MLLFYEHLANNLKDFYGPQEIVQIFNQTAKATIIWVHTVVILECHSEIQRNQ